MHLICIYIFTSCEFRIFKNLNCDIFSELGGYANDFSFNGSRGLSTIENSLSPLHMFDCFDKFIVCNFNAFSDYAPLRIEQHISMNNHPRQKPAYSHKYIQRKRSSWKVEHPVACTESIILNQHRLNDCINIEDRWIFNEVFHVS